MIDQRLVTFLTICKTKNYTKAAELLNLTQPAVTKQVKYLEEYYGAALFRHRGRRIDLTEAGQILLEYAKESKAKSAVLERKIKNSLAIERRYIIGATLTIGEYILPYILGQYKENHPHLDLIWVWWKDRLPKINLDSRNYSMTSWFWSVLPKEP
jgi:DNA-binding transcriptional LysR family regulator